MKVTNATVLLCVKNNRIRAKIRHQFEQKGYCVIEIASPSYNPDKLQLDGANPMKITMAAFCDCEQEAWKLFMSRLGSSVPRSILECKVRGN